ncbi:MAG: hypothetical protein ACK4N5_15610, partial [Myxococcales bacterium]
TVRLFAIALSGALVGLAACVLSPVDFTGKTCAASADCPEGYTCALSNGTCIETGAPEPGADGGAPDAGGDACAACSGARPICHANRCVECAADADCGSGRACCGNVCLDTASDPRNCGACGRICPAIKGSSCGDGLCRVDADVTQTALWSEDAPGPYLALWKDGAVFAASEGAASLLNFTGQGVERTDTRAWTGRPSLHLPRDARATEFVLTHSDAVYALDANLKEVWRTPTTCCRITATGFPLDPVLGRIFLSDFAVLDAYTGKELGEQRRPTFTVHVNQDALLGPDLSGNTVHKRNRTSNELEFSIPVGTPVVTGAPNFDPVAALTAEGGIVVTSSLRNLLARVAADGRKWEKQVDAPLRPVITADGYIVVGAGPKGAERIETHRLTDGSAGWSKPLKGRLVDALVADNGLLYVASSESLEILGLRQSDGLQLEVYRMRTVPQEMLLRDGHLYVSSSGRVTVFAVSAKRYDPQSPWPVRFHDNQRTSSRLQSLEY